MRYPRGQRERYNMQQRGLLRFAADPPVYRAYGQFTGCIIVVSTEPSYNILSMTDARLCAGHLSLAPIALAVQIKRINHSC